MTSIYCLFLRLSHIWGLSRHVQLLCTKEESNCRVGYEETHVTFCRVEGDEMKEEEFFQSYKARDETEIGNMNGIG
jgi:hypothetical protein